jgi:hypothetical protein
VCLRVLHGYKGGGLVLESKVANLKWGMEVCGVLAHNCFYWVWLLNAVTRLSIAGTFFAPMRQQLLTRFICEK